MPVLVDDDLCFDDDSGGPRGAPSQDHPFTADLSGQDFARLIMKGWVPVGLVLGLAIGVRHDVTTSQYAPNTEIGGITYLISATRHDARRKLSQEVRRVGGDGVAVTSVDLAIRERECPKSRGHDRIAQATVAGSAITRFALAHQEACSQRRKALSGLPDLHGARSDHKSSCRMIMRPLIATVPFAVHHPCVEKG
jgi:hypothetical protein